MNKFVLSINYKFVRKIYPNLSKLFLYFLVFINFFFFKNSFGKKIERKRAIRGETLSHKEHLIFLQVEKLLWF